MDDDYKLLIDLHKQGYRQGPGGDAETKSKSGTSIDILIAIHVVTC
jgi:hypothetical protein